MPCGISVGLSVFAQAYTSRSRSRPTNAQTDNQNRHTDHRTCDVFIAKRHICAMHAMRPSNLVRSRITQNRKKPKRAQEYWVDTRHWCKTSVYTAHHNQSHDIEHYVHNVFSTNMKSQWTPTTTYFTTVSQYVTGYQTCNRWHFIFQGVVFLYVVNKAWKAKK